MAQGNIACQEVQGRSGSFWERGGDEDLADWGDAGGSPVELKEWRVEVQPKGRKSVAREYKAKVKPKG